MSNQHEYFNLNIDNFNDALYQLKNRHGDLTKISAEVAGAAGFPAETVNGWRQRRRAPKHSIVKLAKMAGCKPSSLIIANKNIDD